MNKTIKNGGTIQRAINNRTRTRRNKLKKESIIQSYKPARTRGYYQSVKLENPHNIFTPEFEPSPLTKGFKGEHKRYINLLKDDSLECFILNKGGHRRDIQRSNIKIVYANTGLYFEEANKVLKYVQLKKNKICKGINDNYTSYSFSNNSIFLTLSREEKEGDKKYLGFATLKIDDTQRRDKGRILKIDVICASLELAGGGQALLNGVIALAKLFEANYISLESVKIAPTIKFYLKNGFRFNQSNDDHCKESTVFPEPPDDPEEVVKNKEWDALCIMERPTIL